jgi:hypothetical protein
LRGEVIAVPPFAAEHLLRGHAVHFRCHHPDAPRMRVDVMAKMRGVAPFQELYHLHGAMGRTFGEVAFV